MEAVFTFCTFFLSIDNLFLFLRLCTVYLLLEKTRRITMYIEKFGMGKVFHLLSKSLGIEYTKSIKYALELENRALKITLLSF